MQGSILYPLNVLKEKYPEIYEAQVSKYIGREHITEQRIPTLGCLWNDVLHFSAVNPQEIKEALIEAGRDPDFSREYYKIDPKLLEPKNTTVYLYTHKDVSNTMTEENFTSFNPEDVARFSSMPQATKDYYKEMIGKGGRPLLHHLIPHILFKGTLDVSVLPVIKV